MCIQINFFYLLLSVSVNTFLARVILAFSSAYVLYVIVELPFASIEKYLFSKSTKNRQTCVDQLESSQTKGERGLKDASHQQFGNQPYYSSKSTALADKTGQQNQFNSIHRMVNQSKTDYASSSRCSYFTSQMNHNFKEKHHLNLGNQRKAYGDQHLSERQLMERQFVDRHLVDSRYAQDRQLSDRRSDGRQQPLSRFNQQYPYYLNEQDRKYFLYRQKPINQYFYSGSRSNTVSHKTTSRQDSINHSKELSDLSGIKANRSDNDAQQTRTISSTECTVTTSSSLNRKQESNSITNGLKRKPTNTHDEDVTITESTNDTQLTNTQSNNTSNESVNHRISTDSLCETNQLQNDGHSTTSSLKSSKIEHF